MDCLRYLLNLFRRGEKIVILYDGNHCIGKQGDLIFDYDHNQRGDETKYLPLKDWHSKETIKKIFKLDKKYSEIIDQYLLHNKN